MAYKSYASVDTDSELGLYTKEYDIRIDVYASLVLEIHG
jgi:hypothetical protein